MKMKEIMRANDYAIHVGGTYLPRTKTFDINVYSTYDASVRNKDPIRMSHLNLTAEEFDAYLKTLHEIRASDK